MGTTTFLKFLILALMVMELHPKVQGQIWVPRPPPIPSVIPPPLCASQLALVNHACAQLPYMPYPPPYAPSPPSEPPAPTPKPPTPIPTPPAPAPEPPIPVLPPLPPPIPVLPPPPPPIPVLPPPTPVLPPPTPIPEPPTPPSSDSPDNNHRHHHHRHHHHTPSHDGSDDSDDIHQLQRFRFSDSDTLSTTQADCCKWLKEVDNVCVCDVLVHLPSFLTRPIHNYTVYVDASCQVTFSCGSRLVQI